MSNLFSLNIKDVGGLILSAIIVAVLTYLGTLSSIWSADISVVTNIALLTGISSLLKSLGTDNGGLFLGRVQVK